MIEVIGFYIGILFFFILTIIVHEIGHYVVLSKIYQQRKIKIGFYYNSIRDFGLKCGTKQDYQFLTNKQYYMVNFMGVAFGYGFIILLGLLVAPYLILIVIPYSFGIIPDVKEMIKAFKERCLEK